MTLSAACHRLITHGPIVAVEIRHHPLSKAELRDELALWGEAPSLSLKFLVDTGSPHSLIDQETIESLRIPPISTNTDVATPGGTLRECPQYRVELCLNTDNGQSVFPTTIIGVRATALLPHPSYQGILGRSSMKNIRFLYDGAAGTFNVEVVKK